jgi:predicted cupin superfamily sugar epimerase
MDRAKELREKLNMEYLEGESGYVGLIGQDTARVTTVATSPKGGEAAALPAQSHIHYMLTAEHPLNALHWLESCDTHILLEGGPVDYYIFHPDGAAEKVTLGADLAAGQARVVPVPSNCYKALKLHPDTPFALMANCLSPGWTPERVRIGAGDEFLQRYRGAAPWATADFLREIIGPNFNTTTTAWSSSEPEEPDAAAAESAPLPDPALRFVEDPLPEDENAELVSTFRRQGWCCLRNVFQRDSVMKFRRQVLDKFQPPSPSDAAAAAGARWTLPQDAPELVAPVLAPRLRAFVPQLLTPPHPRGEPSLVQLFELAWQAEPGPLEAQGWHRDRSGGAGEPGNADNPAEDSYRFPEAVHCTAYYRDMPPPPPPPPHDGGHGGHGGGGGGGGGELWAIEPGSTEILSGSHLDASCPRPASGTAGGWSEDATVLVARTTEAAPTTWFAPRAEDVIVWDQRCWHRRGPFTPEEEEEEGGSSSRRLMSIFGFHQTQMFRGTGYAKPNEMPTALAMRWEQANQEGDYEAAALLGGRWQLRDPIGGGGGGGGGDRLNTAAATARL